MQLTRQGRLEDAALLYQSLLKADPKNPDCLRELGVIRLRQGRLEDAAAALRRARERAPASAAVLSALGAALSGLGRYREAVARLEQATSIDPSNADAWIRLGQARLAVQDGPGAVAATERAVAARPEYTPARLALGEALEALGRLEAAGSAYEAALDLAPRDGLLHRRLAECRKSAPDDPHVATMEALISRPAGLTPLDQAHLHAALAKAYEDQGDPARAFGHVLAGNALHRRQFEYREAETVGLLDRIAETFSAELLAAKAGLGHPSASPVFIVGMPRSGSTLVEQVLAGHPQVFGAGETRSFDTEVTGLGLGRLETPEFLAAVPTLGKKELYRLGAGYLAALNYAPAGVQRITNKLLGNFLYAGLIRLALPNARIVHVVRDPVDTCVSRFSRMMIPGQPYSYDLAELGRYHRSYERLMAHWRAVLPPGVMLDVRYEDMVADLEGQAQRLAAHCGLAWDPACLAFHESSRAVTTPSRAQVREPLYSRAVGRWRRHADALQPLLDALGVDAASV